jgi:hypothetical protein
MIYADDLKCLCEIRLTNGLVRRIQNWQGAPLTYKGKQWNYLAFPMPPLTQKMGEDAQSLTVLLPNVKSGEHGYLPIRDWCQDGSLLNAFVTFYIFLGSGIINQHVFVVAERIFDDSDLNESAQIQIRLRQPDDRYCRILTQSYNNSILGESARYSSF